MKNLVYMTKEEIIKELYKYYVEEEENPYDYQIFKDLLKIQFKKEDMVILLANKRKWKGIII